MLRELLANWCGYPGDLVVIEPVTCGADGWSLDTEVDLPQQERAAADELLRVGATHLRRRGGVSGYFADVRRRFFFAGALVADLRRFVAGVRGAEGDGPGQAAGEWLYNKGSGNTVAHAVAAEPAQCLSVARCAGCCGERC
eukprot:gene8685-51545_t